MHINKYRKQFVLYKTNCVSVETINMRYEGSGLIVEGSQGAAFCSVWQHTLEQVWKNHECRTHVLQCLTVFCICGMCLLEVLVSSREALSSLTLEIAERHSHSVCVNISGYTFQHASLAR